MPKPPAPRTDHGVWRELRVYRNKDGMSLTALHKTTGLSLSYISDLERGRQLPSADAITKIAKALNVPVSVLERSRNVDADGNDIALVDLIRRIVREELDARGIAA